MMKTFAFLTHPINRRQLKNFWPCLRKFRVSRLEKVGGYLISAQKFIEPLEEIIEATEIAHQLGAKILGIDRCLSAPIGDKIYTKKKGVKLPVTCGSVLTAWSAYEAVYRVTRAKEIGLREATIAIVGATGAVGSLCARKFSLASFRMNLHGFEESKLIRLKEAILGLGSNAGIRLSLSVLEAIKDADVIIFAEGLPQPGLSLEGIKPGAIVCDASPQHSIAAGLGKRPDISVIKGGLMKLPPPAKFSLNGALPGGIIPAALAETMLLALENKCVSYSLGENINLDKLEEIADIAARHGFEVWVPEAPLL